MFPITGGKWDYHHLRLRINQLDRLIAITFLVSSHSQPQSVVDGSLDIMAVSVSVLLVIMHLAWTRAQTDMVTCFFFTLLYLYANLFRCSTINAPTNNTL